MNHSKLIGRENRLISYIKSPYTSTNQARLDTRNLAAQTQAQQQANLDAQRAQQAKVNEANAFQAEKAAFAEKQGNEYNPTTFSRTAGTTDVGTGITGTQLDADGKSVTSRQSSSVVMDRSKPTSMYATGTPLQFGSQINDALKTTTIPRLTHAQSLQQQRDAELATIPTTIQQVIGMNEDGSPQYQTITNPNLASDQSKIKNRFANEDLTKSTNQATETLNVQSRTAGDADTQKSRTPPKLPDTQKSAPQAVPDEVKIEEYGTMIDGAIAASGDPLGPMIKGMMMMEYRNSLTKEANALTALDSAIEGAGAADDAFQKMNDRYLEIHRQENGKLTNLLTETRDSTEKYLDEQKERDLERLTWEQDSDTRKLEKQKTDQMLSKEIQLSLTGGAFSGAANDRLDATEREWDVAIADLGKEYSFKKADQSAFYTQKYVETQNQFRMDIFNAAKSLTSTIEGYEIKGFNSLAAKGNAIAVAKKEYNDTITKISDDRVTSMKDMVKDMRETLKQAAKDRKDGMVSTKDKLGFTQSLRAGIQQNKIITLANDVDGFYGSFEAGYDEYKFLIGEIEAGRMKPGDISLNPSQSGAIGALARMFDPGSVVRNEEYERQVLGQAAPNIISGWLQKLRAGGTGLTTGDLDAMKRVAEGLHGKWEEKLSENLQPFIIDIDDWNASYPDSQIKYEQVISNIDRVHIPSQTFSRWEQQANDTTGSTQPTDGPTPNWVASIGPVVTGSPYHKGKDVFAIDIDGKTGDPIPSSVSGKVISVDNIGSGGYGKNVVIQDAMGYSHLFAHMDSVDVERGSSVNSAQSLGKMGNTGNVIPGKNGDGSHLHYRITDKSGQPVSYNEYLAFNNEANGTGKTQYSLVPSAHASEPHDSIYIEPEPEAKPEPKKAPAVSLPQTGQTLGMFSPVPVLGQAKVLGAFKDIKTGESIYPTTQGLLDHYKSKPHFYKDLNTAQEAPVVIPKLKGPISSL